MRRKKSRRKNRRIKNRRIKESKYLRCPPAPYRWDWGI